MKPADLKALRNTLDLNQADMATRMGLGARAYQALEAGESAIRPIHVNAAERAALAIAVERRQPMLAPASIRREALDLAAMLRGE
jgi:transcriptional regulator with XRE-family HTH domain